MKIFALVLLTVIISLTYDIVYGRNGIVQFDSVSAQYDAAVEKAKRLEQRNEVLSDVITDLKQGNSVVEDLARSDLGMVKRNETFYRVIEKNDNTLKASR